MWPARIYIPIYIICSYIYNIFSFKLIIVTVNVALNKPAYQQNPFFQTGNVGDASNAVDGKRSDLTRNGGQCVLSGARETATWWVNLTSTHNIQNISIYFMTDNKPWGIVFFNNNCFYVVVFYVNVSPYTSPKFYVFFNGRSDPNWRKIQFEIWFAP